MTEKLISVFEEYHVEYREALAFSDVLCVRAHLLPKAFAPRSVLLFLMPYYVSDGVNLSRYATSLDYHLGAEELGAALLPSLEAIFPEGHFALFADRSPINERQAALSAGLGILGDNGLLISEKYGSYVFIGEILTDLSPSDVGAVLPKPVRRCEGCGACKNACPTGILRGTDAACLSAVTQKKGTLSEEEKRLMRAVGTAWGCDLCQSVCPHNQNPEKTPLSFFTRDRMEALTEEGVLALDDEAFAKRAFSWRGRDVLLRNLSALNEMK